MKTNSRELMINRNGKPIFAVALNDIEDGKDANYVFVENGDIKFASSWFRSIIPFHMSDASHRLAKEIFTVGLQCAVKTRIMELKQLESILTDLNLEDCLGDVMVNNARALFEVNKNIEKISMKMDKTTTEIKENIITYGIDLSYGVDYACEITTMVNKKTGKGKVIKCKICKGRDV